MEGLLVQLGIGVGANAVYDCLKNVFNNDPNITRNELKTNVGQGGAGIKQNEDGSISFFA